jgi:hypothetical protein
LFLPDSWYDISSNILSHGYQSLQGVLSAFLTDIAYRFVQGESLLMSLIPSIRLPQSS